MHDHLLDWWHVRDRVPWATATHPAPGPSARPAPAPPAHPAPGPPVDPARRPVSGRRDGILDHVNTAEVARCPDRAARLLDALHQVHDAAAGPEPLHFALLARWQAVVLGVPAVGFRTGTAYAKAGRERYGLGPTTRPRFATCLTEATDPRLPLAARAARVYLDVAFVHPFPDGNARAALLCLAFVLHRDHATIHPAAPALTLVRRADDLPGTVDFVRLIDLLMRPGRLRSATELSAGLPPAEA
ncbi:Fic family protein [Symbioplanes lichenis]|uniref:Fic family protein n=1 Tax=Symbioplanes lichenis TaxID=1629072 RepID=UPI00273A068E|nr:Fic family protein [Actinoplanes lichenis]